MGGGAPLRIPRQHVDGRDVQPRRRQADGRPGHARPRAPGRTAVRALRGGRGVAGGPAAPGLEGCGAQLGARFDLRLLGRRRGGRCAAPLRRGPHHRRRPGRSGRHLVRTLVGRAGQLCPQPHATGAGGGGGARRRRSRGVAWGRAGRLRAHRPAGLDGARRQHRAHRAGDVAGAQDRQRRLGPGHRHRRGRHGDRHHGHRGGGGTTQRRHLRGQAGHLHPAGRASRRRGPHQPQPASHQAHRRPRGRRPGVRVAALRPGAAFASRRGAPGRRPDLPLQRPRDRGGRRGHRHLLPQRPVRVWPPGRRRGSRRLLQLLTATRRHAGRHATHRLGPPGRARPGPGQCGHQRNLRLA